MREQPNLAVDAFAIPPPARIPSFADFHATEPSSETRRRPSGVGPASKRRASYIPRPANERAKLVARPQRTTRLRPSLVPVPLESSTAHLIEKYSPLVKRIAGGFLRKLPLNVMRDDLVAAGMSGLWDAIRRHQETPHESFEWYVRVRIRGAILDDLRAQDWLPRRARNGASDVTRTTSAPHVVRLDDVSEYEQSRCLTDTESSDSEAAVDAKLTSERLSRAVDQLPQRERHIVSQHYFKGVRFKELGAELGVSEPRISQLHSRAMQRLKALLDNAA